MTTINIEEKIYMTPDQKEIWDKALDESKEHEKDFIYFLDFLSTVETVDYAFSTDYIFPEFRSDSRNLMLAWLFPELIEVKEND